jgi:hypothetical protein
MECLRHNQEAKVRYGLLRRDRRCPDGCHPSCVSYKVPAQSVEAVMGMLHTRGVLTLNGPDVAVMAWTDDPREAPEEMLFQMLWRINTGTGTGIALPVPGLGGSWRV